MPRLSEVPRSEVHPFGEVMYALIFGDRDPVAEPGTASGTPGNWWTVTAQIPEMFDHIAGGLQFRGVCHCPSLLPVCCIFLGMCACPWRPGRCRSASVSWGSGRSMACMLNSMPVWRTCRWGFWGRCSGWDNFIIKTKVKGQSALEELHTC